MRQFLETATLAVALLCTSLVLAPPVDAQGSLSRGGGEFGLGVIIGDPTGVNGKYFLSREMAVDGSIGFGILGGDHVKMQMDFLWHFGIQRWSAASLDLYAGIGPALAFWDHDHGPGRRDHDGVAIGARAPFGAALTFNNAPFDIFLELALGLWIIENVDADVDAALGVRFWF